MDPSYKIYLLIFQTALPITAFHYGYMYLNIQKASIKIGPLECKGKSEAMNNGGSCQSLKSQGRSSGYYILDTSQDNRYTEDSYRYSRRNLVMPIFVFS